MVWGENYVVYGTRRPNFNTNLDVSTTRLLPVFHKTLQGDFLGKQSTRGRKKGKGAVNKQQLRKGRTTWGEKKNGSLDAFARMFPTQKREHDVQRLLSIAASMTISSR